MKSPAVECRSLDHHHLESAGQLLAEAYPHRAHEPAWWQRSSEREQMQQWGLFDLSALSADHLVAYAAIWRVDGPKCRFDVIVNPPDRRCGHGNRLFELVRREAERGGAETLQARAYGTATDSLAFLARRRFVETMRMRGFALPLPEIDFGSLAAASKSCRMPDVSIETIPRQGSAMTSSGTSSPNSMTLRGMVGLIPIPAVQCQLPLRPYFAAP